MILKQTVAENKSQISTLSPQLLFPSAFVGDANSFAVEQMSVSLFGGSVTQWMIAGTAQMNPLTAVSALSTVSHRQQRLERLIYVL